MDLDGNDWATQDHFIFNENDTDKKKAIGINYDSVREYVDENDFRGNKKSIAAEGYVS